MHFEILVEDISGKKALDILVPKIIGEHHTYCIHAYKGVGRIPKNLKPGVDASKRILLNQLPRLLAGYGKTFKHYGPDYSAAVIVVCDLDDKCLKTFRQELQHILVEIEDKPETEFCLAIEEGEAWLLGDIDAVKQAYPLAKAAVLTSYKNDSICGTWEALADAVYKGGAKALSDKGWHAVGAEKSHWSENISPHMDVNNNQSPSFNYFKDRLLTLASQS